MNIETILKKIDSFDYVSFDVFDTLLLRPYVKPTDLFRHMEMNEDLSGFTKSRISAEKSTRSKVCPEVALEEIYDNIDKKFKECMDLEIEYESQILRCNPEMKRPFNYAVSENKKIVLISDMYLPSDIIRNILDERGFFGYDKLYTSCEYRKSKHFGDLFEHVIDDLGIDAGQLLHIGDNAVSDVRTPSKIGIETVHYSKFIDRYFKTHRREYRYYRMNRNVERSMIIGVDALHWLESSADGSGFWYDIGYRYGGPVNAAFASFIDRNAEKDGTLLFVARDGHNPQKAYNVLYGDVENHYIYAVRIFNILFGINGRDYPGYEEDIVRYFSGDPEVEALEGTFKEKYFGNRELFDRLMDEEMEKYSRYIKKYTDSKENIYIVDATTEKFSSQNLIEKASGKKTRGLYYTLLRSDSNDKAKGFNDGYRVLLELTSIDLPEFLMTSNENPVRSMDHTGHPIYSETEPDEWYRGDITSEVTRGVEEYARTLRSIFGKYLPSFEYDTIGKWTRSLARNMSEFEYSKLKELKWASDPAHLEYHNLFFSPSDAPLLMRYKIRDYRRSLMRRIRE